MTKKEYQALQKAKREHKKAPASVQEYLKAEDYRIIKEEAEAFVLLDLLFNNIEEIKKTDLYARYEAYKKAQDYTIEDEPQADE